MLKNSCSFPFLGFNRKSIATGKTVFPGGADPSAVSTKGCGRVDLAHRWPIRPIAPRGSSRLRAMRPGYPASESPVGSHDWGFRCTTHFRLPILVGWDWDVHYLYDFLVLTHGQMPMWPMCYYMFEAAERRKPGGFAGRDGWHLAVVCMFWWTPTRKPAGWGGGRGGGDILVLVLV